MKLAFVVYNDLLMPRVMELLRDCDIDYYTRWDGVKGKGRGTEPHLGTGSFASTNAALMIAFEAESPLEMLIERITTFNLKAPRPDEQVRIFQMPLERIV